MVLSGKLQNIVYIFERLRIIPFHLGYKEYITKEMTVSF